MLKKIHINRIDTFFLMYNGIFGVEKGILAITIILTA